MNAACRSLFTPANASDRAAYARRSRLVIARAGTLAALAVIAAAIGAGLGYAVLVLMAAAS